MPNTIEIRVTADDDTTPGLTKARASMARFVKHTEQQGDEAGKGFRQRFLEGAKGDDIGGRIGHKLLSSLAATLKPGAVAIATGFSAQVTGAIAAGLASGAVKIAQGFGAALALLPAAALAGGLALGTLKLALAGVGDALKAGLTGDTEKFNEALEGMAPAAQDVLREIVGLKGGFDGLKATVQSNFFGPLVGQIRPLADLYLPAIDSVLGRIAKSFGTAGASISELLQGPRVAKSLMDALKNAGIATDNLIDGVDSLVAAFIPLVTVGSTFLPRLTDGFGRATAKLAEFMREAERTGRLREFIQDGIDAIKSLIETGKQWVRILGNIADVGRVVFEGLGIPAGTLLDKIEKLSEKAKEFFESGKGDPAIATVFSLANRFADAFFGTLQKVGEILQPILPEIGDLLIAFMELKVAFLDALAPAVQFIGEEVLPVLTSLMNWLADNTPVMQGILIGLFTAWALHAGIAAAATIAATWPLILLGVAVAVLATLIIIHWKTIANAVTNAVDVIEDQVNRAIRLFNLLPGPDIGNRNPGKGGGTPAPSKSAGRNVPRQAGGPGGGWTMVGEIGPELVHLPTGSFVNPAGAGSNPAARGGSGRVELVVTEATGSPLERFIVELIQRHVKVNHGGDTQAALGFS